MKAENGFYTWTKGDKKARFTLADGKETIVFCPVEFDCKCTNATCTTQKLSAALVEALVALRAACGFSLRITSGYRCQAHQTAIKGQAGVTTVSQSGQHPLGIAADVQPSTRTNESWAKFIKLVDEMFMNIGLAATFRHVDMRTPKPDGKKRLWNY